MGVGPEGVVEYDTFTCHHGNEVVTLTRPFDELGSICKVCMGRICRKCTGGVCRPFMKEIEEQERQARKRAH